MVHQCMIKQPRHLFNRTPMHLDWLF